MREGWTETTLGDVAEYINGYPFKPSDLGEIGTAVIRIKQLLEPSEKVDRTIVKVPERCVLRDGDIVFSWSGTLAVRVWNRGPAYLNQHLFRVVEKPGVNHDWLPLVIDHAIEELLEKSHGTTMKHITKQTLLPHQVLLPPIAEQKRIVDVVSSVDAYIDALQHQVDAARTARNAIGENAVNSGYPVAKLSDIGRVITGSTPPTKRLEYWEPEEVDFVTAGDFGAQLLIKTASRMVSREGANVSRLLSSHSVMQVCIGATIGKVGYVSHEVVTNQQINSIVGLEELDAYFVALMLSTNEMQASIRDRAGTTTLPIISKSGWGELSIPWPDGSVRESISVLAKSIDEFIFETDRTVVEAKNLRSGLLSDLLSGEHEIPVSYDELLGAA